MKTKISSLVLALAILAGSNSQLIAQGTAFTYQGQLNSSGSPANGLYDFEFSLFNASSNGSQIGGTITNLAVGVTNGLFTTTLDFGPVFVGNDTWLAIDVRTNGIGGFEGLSPLQPLTPAPYSIFATTASNVSGTVSAAQLSGTVLSTNFAGIYGNAVSLTNPSNNFTGNGANVTNVNAARLNGLSASNFWQLSGNNVAAGQILGSTNNQAVELWVNNGRAMRLEPGVNADGAPNVIEGSSVNYVQPGVVGATISGGGATNYMGNTYSNYVFGDFGTVGGGAANIAFYQGTVGGGNGNYANSAATVAGGYENTANQYYATVGGGVDNIADYCATVAGGVGNMAKNTCDVIGGGSYNTANNTNATIAGGEDNSALNICATVGGGNFNYASGPFSSIGGGSFNYATNENATVAGGFANDATNSYATIGGGTQNIAGGPISFIGGGAANSAPGALTTVGGGQANSAMANNSTIVGGLGNTNDGVLGFIGAGYLNNIQNTYATIGGGAFNTASGLAASVGGGTNNFINVEGGTIGGGENNSVFDPGGTVSGGQFNSASGLDSAIGGGNENVAGNTYATVPGGFGNAADGLYSFAAGDQAMAMNNGAFVWADSQNIPFSSTANNQFLIRAQGGVGIGLNNPAAQVQISSSGGGNFPQLRLDQTAGSQYSRLRMTSGTSAETWDIAVGGGPPNVMNFFASSTPGGSGTNILTLFANGNADLWGTLAQGSDRAHKENIQPIDPQAVLAKVAQMPVTEWNYITEHGVSHLGPMAQDFYAAFQLGADNRHITTIDEGGVALAAIQGLNQKLEETQQAAKAKDAEIQNLKQLNDSLSGRLDQLEVIVKALSEKK